MSIERELLSDCLLYLTIESDLRQKIEKELLKPKLGSVKKRLNSIDYEIGFSKTNSTDYTSFVRGIKYAEKEYGI